MIRANRVSRDVAISVISLAQNIMLTWSKVPACASIERSIFSRTLLVWLINWDFLGKQY